MLRAPAVSRPAWLTALSGGGGSGRRSPVEVVATAASYLTRTQAADLPGLRAGPLGRWTDGVTAMRGDCVSFASHWQAHNYRILTETGPLWVVLGDSTGQGLGAPSPEGSGRRPRFSIARRQVFVAIRYSQVRIDDRPSNPEYACQARSSVSCSWSSASWTEPSIR